MPDRFEGFSNAAYQAALKLINTNSHLAAHMMVAKHASRRG
jgi:hypothetical protein